MEAEFLITPWSLFILIKQYHAFHFVSAGHINAHVPGMGSYIVEHISVR